VGLRLGLTPQHTVTPRTVPPVTVMAGVRPPRDPASLVLAARSETDAEVVIVDAGPLPVAEAVTDLADEVVMVTTDRPISLLRAATELSRWRGPQPIPVVNQCPADLDLRPVRAALGLEPAVIPFADEVAAAARSAVPPPPVEGLVELADRLDAGALPTSDASCKTYRP
jgi:hypothetical protein